MKFSKAIITTIVLLNSIFTIAVLYIVFHTGNEPTSLIAAWFAFTTGELWMLSSIKKQEIKQDSKETIAEQRSESKWK